MGFFSYAFGTVRIFLDVHNVSEGGGIRGWGCISQGMIGEGGCTQGPQGGAKKFFCTQKKKKRKVGGCKKYFCTPPKKKKSFFGAKKIFEGGFQASAGILWLFVSTTTDTAKHH